MSHHHGGWAVPDGSPYTPQERLEPDAVLLGRPPLDLRVREGVRDGS
ncbi:MAG TPA: hypothetical protein VGP82_02485 [Ktedonobacterales bacterium]|nr:hypothetical protein [Ktedonobacterales bacterium]